MVAEDPTAKTFVKLNSLLESANNKLYHSPPFRMTVREDVSEEEVRTLARNTTVRFLREAK